MKKITYSLLMFLSCAFGAFSQTTLFYDDFTSDQNGPGQTGSITNWNILSGDIDVSDTYIKYTSYTGKAIDLAGYENGSIETKKSISLDAGTYTISFLAKDNTWGNSSMKLEIGSVFVKTFNATATATLYSETFTVTSPVSVKIKLTEMGPNNTGGTFVADFKLVTECKPTSKFYDDFTADQNGPGKTVSITNWNILSGDIDVSDTYISYASYTGKAIDLAGYQNGSIETKNSISLGTGTYTISFLAKDNTWGNSSMKLEIGSVFTKTFNATATAKLYTEKFTITSPSSVKIKLTEMGPNNTGGTFVADFKLQLECPIVTSIADVSQNMETVRVYPNPSNGVVNIESHANNQISVVSSDGKLQYQIEGGLNNQYQLNLEPGMYILKVKNEGNNSIESHKILIFE